MGDGKGERMNERIVNTSKNPRPDWLLGGDPAAIENQEAQGQKEMCRVEQLPRTDGYKDLKDKYKQLGIKVLGETEGDDLFYDVTLPEGWKIIPTDHSMWSNLVNEKGKIIANIFYKAAFYDRAAHIHIIEKKE